MGSFPGQEDIASLKSLLGAFIHTQDASVEL